ncbi:hypothetical protein HF638_22015 [Paenibacillus sp. SZ31]|uniref:hypothetical protein n=1 Tax=unclassified Paenibacillus TaxID=185978 RepID=UPI00146A0DE7|nr:hypothetical protein [Paenibacillus sp. SZ31]NMI06668.1 hypothetical protein [Paenibacillus sp. SZ31]
MLSVVVLGFAMERLEGFSDIAWASHDASTASDLSNREYTLIIEKVVLQADAVLVNLDMNHLTSTDIVIMHRAYIHKKPILGVGFTQLEPVIEEFVSKRVADLDMAVLHMRTNYMVLSSGTSTSSEPPI